MGRQLISFISQEVGNGLNPEEAVFALITEIKSLMDKQSFAVYKALVQLFPREVKDRSFYSL